MKETTMENRNYIMLDHADYEYDFCIRLVKIEKSNSTFTYAVRYAKAGFVTCSFLFEKLKDARNYYKCMLVQFEYFTYDDCGMDNLLDTFKKTVITLRG